MKRHEKLIPLSRSHHQLLVLSQVLKRDVPAYKGLPDTLDGKKIYVKDRLHKLLLPNIQIHKRQLYKNVRELAPTLSGIIEPIEDLEDSLIEYLANYQDADLDSLHEMGLLIQDIVRKRERILYQSIQEELPDWLDELEEDLSI